ncbi:MmcB family DNA repair protein [Pararhizobium mangrovi]|uniref:MmcB family DNA repair protein n=1 Tax=Pararhizobium mangrovi TaxID=2590452 RepID=A0A506U202_9HYPH|nr:MmcB family DNA repair protein [Pararhizobium mangrovi]TPW28392.1 MmcB family DNA repair protein [Pararhizobium mangrovi]
MPLVSPHAASPLIDGRQSERAMMVRRGVQGRLAAMRLSVLPELTLPNGRRADLIALSPKGEVWIVEIKTSVQDLRVDGKWPEYRPFCDRLFFATHSGVPAEIFPAECGLMVADGYDAHLLREAPEHRIAPARRKAIVLQVAQAAADRLMRAEHAIAAIPA